MNDDKGVLRKDNHWTIRSQKSRGVYFSRSYHSATVALQFHSTTEVVNIISQFLTFVTGSPSFPRLCPIFKIETPL